MSQRLQTKPLCIEGDDLFPHVLWILLRVKNRLTVFSHIQHVTHFPENGQNVCFWVKGFQCLFDVMAKTPIVNTLVFLLAARSSDTARWEPPA